MENENQAPVGTRLIASGPADAPSTASALSQASMSARQHRRKRSITIFVVVSIINVGLLALLWSQLLTPAHNATPGQAADPLVGHPAPAFRLTALNTPTNQTTLSLNDLKGKAIVLNVWASWCAPCNQEAPMLQSTWNQLKSQGKNIVFLGVDFQDASKDALTFLHKYGINYPNVLDATGSVSIDYGVTGVPETIFINSQGTVISTVRQELTAQALQSNLQLII